MAVGVLILGIIGAIVLAAIIACFAVAALSKNTALRVVGAVLGCLILCGVGAAVLLSAIIVRTGKNIVATQKELRHKEETYQRIAYKKLGQEIASRHAGGKILLIRYAAGNAEAATSMTKAQMDGLNAGLAGKTAIAATEELSSVMQPGDNDTMLDPGGMLTAERFDAMLADNPECNVVVSLVGLPYDMQAMQYWKQAQKDPQAVPRLVLVNAHTYELKQAIAAGHISVVLQNKPEIYDWNAPVPPDEDAAFNNRFIVITPDNIDQVAAKYPMLFKAD